MLYCLLFLFFSFTANHLDTEIQDFLKKNHITAKYYVQDTDNNILAYGKYEDGVNKLSSDKILCLSVTKHMTSYLIVNLIYQNKLSYETKIIDILDKSHYIWKNQEPPAWAYNVTIYELLSHTSGIQDYLYDALMSGVELKDIKLAKQNTVAISAAKAQKRKVYDYSNINYFLLGIILEELYLDSIDNIFNKYLFKPAAMHKTRFFSPEEALVDNNGSIVSLRQVTKSKDVNLNAKGLVYLYMLKKRYSNLNIDVFLSPNLSILPYTDGGVMSSVEDLMKMLQFFYKEGIYSNQIGKDIFQSVHIINNEQNVGLGSHIIRKHILGHSGDAVGNRCEAFYFTKHKVFVVLYSNLEPLKRYYISSKKEKSTKAYDVNALLYYIDDLLNDRRSIK